jgi:hypothetical protein
MQQDIWDHWKDESDEVHWILQDINRRRASFLVVTNAAHRNVMNEAQTEAGAPAMLGQRAAFLPCRTTIAVPT